MSHNTSAAKKKEELLISFSRKKIRAFYSETKVEVSDNS